MCQEETRNLNKPYAADNKFKNSKDNEILDFEYLLTSIHPRLFENFSEQSVQLAMDAGVSLGRKMLQEGAKDILDEIKGPEIAQKSVNDN